MTFRGDIRDELEKRLLLNTMRIAFDAKRIFNNQTGLGNYSRTLVDNLQQYYPAEDYLLCTPKLPVQANKYTTQFKTLTPSTSFKHIWRSYSIKKDLEREGVDLYHGLSNEIPFWLRKIKTVVTIHDVIFKILPNTYPQLDRWLYEEKTQYACKHASMIIAISEQTKQDLIQFCQVAPERIKVVYQPCQPIFYETNQIGKGAINFNTTKLPSEYMLYVGSITERKNLLSIVKSIWQMREDQRLPLVIVGNGKNYKKTVEAYIASHKLEKWIYWIDNLRSTEQLKQLYQEAQLLVYPSFYEGFGLPVVEAMLCGTPVITSNVSALPEAGGQFAKLINPNEVGDLRTAIQEILSDSDLRLKMSIAGRKDALERFDPEKLTRAMMKVYRSAVGSRQ